ncbi:MAG: ABC transporter permease subunit [Pseudohongiellaceae bacterium]
MLRWASYIFIMLLAAPILLGTLLASLPAFGYFPPLDSYRFSLDAWRQLIEVPGITQSVLISLLCGVLTPLIALTLVFLYLASASGSRLDNWIRRLISPLLSFPHAAAAFGLAFLIAPSGLLSRALSPGLSGWERPPDLLIVNDTWGLSLMLGLVVKEVPFLLLMSLAALPQLQPVPRIAVARSLGYRPTIAWLKVIAPSLYPLVRLPVFAVIVFASATVDVALILGPTLPPTLSVRVLAWFNDPNMGLRFLAAAGALAQLATSLLAVTIWLALERICRLLWRLYLAAGDRNTGERVAYILGRTAMPAVLLIISGSLLALLMNAFAGPWRYPSILPSTWTLQHWANSYQDLLTPLFNTLTVSICSTLIALMLVIATLESEGQPAKRNLTPVWILYLPLLIPQVVFLFGIIVLTEFGRWQASMSLVVFGHLLFVIPYVFLSLSAAYRQLDPRWSQVAATLGASQSKTFWRVRVPLLLAPCLTAVAIGMAISISLYLPTQLLGAGRITTITSEAVALTSGASRNLISVWAIVQLGLPMLGFVAALSIPRLVWRNRIGMQEIR